MKQTVRATLVIDTDAPFTQQALEAELETLLGGSSLALPHRRAPQDTAIVDEVRDVEIVDGASPVIAVATDSSIYATKDQLRAIMDRLPPQTEMRMLTLVSNTHGDNVQITAGDGIDQVPTDEIGYIREALGLTEEGAT